MLVIQCVDKKFYDQPLWWGQTDTNRKWMMHLDTEIERLFLVLEAPKKHDRETEKARTIVQDWPIKVGSKEWLSVTIFPNSDEGVTAYRFELEIQGLLPIPQQYRIAMTEPPMDAISCCWCVPFKTEHVWAYMQNRIEAFLSPRLAAFVLGSQFALPKQHKEKIARMLAQQFPGMGKLKLPEAIAKFGDHMEVERKWGRGSKSKKGKANSDSSTTKPSELPETSQEEE